MHSISITHHWSYDELKIKTLRGTCFTSQIENASIYVIDNGYKIESDSGNPSTVYAYGNAVEKILETEGLSWSDLAKDIDNLVNIYGENGPKWAIGKKSNETYINALRRFQDMVHSQSY